MKAEVKNLVGPKVQRLIARKMAMSMVPPGGGFMSAIENLTAPEKLKAHATEAKTWVMAAIRTLRTATGENPWVEASDEEIASYLLQEIEKREQKQASR